MVFCHEGKIIVFLDYHSSETSANVLLSLCIQLLKEMKAVANCKVIIGTGQVCSDLAQIAQSYQQAVASLFESFVAGKENIVYQASGDIIKTSSSDIEKINLMLKSVEAGEEQQIFHELDSFLHRMSRADLPAQSMNALYEGIFKLYKEETLQSSITQYARLKSIPFGSIEQLKGNMHEMIQSIIKNRDGLKLAEYSYPVRKVLEYIHTHYSEDISLNSICEHFNKNASYLSKIFKKNTGSTITDYVNGIRIDKAKQLLMESNHHIYQVSSLVGFNNSKYFNKVFREMTGRTPTEFREDNLA
jgi:two-component system response regulator YesN